MGCNRLENSTSAEPVVIVLRPPAVLFLVGIFGTIFGGVFIAISIKGLLDRHSQNGLPIPVAVLFVLAGLTFMFAMWAVALYMRRIVIDPGGRLHVHRSWAFYRRSRTYERIEYLLLEYESRGSRSRGGGVTI